MGRVQSLDELDNLLREGQVSWQTTTTWKAFTYPDFFKLHRILALFDTPPTDGRVICVDEFDPLDLYRAWARPGGRQAGPADCRRRTTATAG
ncbi:hypothetical protein [Micromonospora sp. NPDC006431]|uniref:hypothetical protein n=1 Tax=Micromonospora sp. NPDC006431 TaxID=3364235 RepID=UPI0036A4A648